MGVCNPSASESCQPGSCWATVLLAMFSAWKRVSGVAGDAEGEPPELGESPGIGRTPIAAVISKVTTTMDVIARPA